MIAEIIPDKRTNALKESFSYLVPEELNGEIRIGSLVTVPFGKKSLRGVVIALSETIDPVPPYELKTIGAIDIRFAIPENYIRLIQFIASYYLCSLGEALALILPPELTRPRLEKENDHHIRPLKELSRDQNAILKLLTSELGSGSKKPALLFGVTGSGKTEIYLHLVQEAVKRSKQAVVLVPEIMLTPQTVERFRANFGDKVAIVHSGLSKSERHKAYFDFYSGVKPIVIGPRSALFVPTGKLGLIIIDEAEDASYKQDCAPRYQAVRVAEELSRLTGALLVMGTATPSVDFYHKAMTGEYSCHELHDRYQKTTMPTAEIVDLRNEIKGGNYSPISYRLAEAIVETLAKKRQLFLYLNRRGAATFVSCRDCGNVLVCPKCDIPLVYHLETARHYLNCHHCDHTAAVPSVCDVCGSSHIKYFGAGVEKIEREIVERFPSARIVRVDSKTMTSKHDYERVYRSLRNHEVDIVIGTQAIAKGLDIPTVDLVGIISADVGLHLPHYKAEERVFQLLTQVSGRSGRGEDIGRTIIQTYWPEKQAVRAASEHNFKSFFDGEVLERQKYGHPPFIRLVRVVSEHESEARAKQAVREIAEAAERLGIPHIGPAKAFFAKLHNRHRYHIICKCESLPDPRIKELFAINPYLVWDVEPENLL